MSIEWAELICVMDAAQLRKLKSRFGASLKGRRVACLRIADDYAFMDAALVRRLRAVVPPLLRAR
jgi:predicted protein tyrosine phosphatase